MFGVIGTSVFTTCDHDLHRIRRAPWSPYFSKQSIGRIHPALIQPTVDKLCRKLAYSQDKEEPIVITHAWACLTADIASAYSFPQGYDLLSRPGFDGGHYNYKAWMAFSWTTHTCRHMAWLFTIINIMPLPFIKLVSSAFYMSLRERDNLLSQAKAMKAGQVDTIEKDTTSRPSLVQNLVETDLLPEVEKSPERITSEAQLAMAGGTVTTAHCLKAATYHILANDNVHRKLMDELSTGFPDPNSPPSLEQLERMPYLVAIMYESLRLFYGLSHRLQRVFPDRAMYYKDWVIPPRTPVGMTIVHIHDNEEIFPEPRAFKPERWLPLETEGHRLLRFLVAFGGGSRGCVGQELGKAEILTVLACVFRRFGKKMRLHDTLRERDVDTVHDLFNPLPSRQSNGVLVVIEKEADADTEA